MTTTRPGMPYANTALAKFLNERIEALKGVKTQREIASEIGYDKPNILSMFKRGESKVPLEKVPALARALDSDPKHLLRLGFEVLWPDHAGVIEEVLGGELATKNEADIFLKRWRIVTDNADPAPNAAIQAAFDRLFAEIALHLGPSSTLGR
jgi:transcriptional regulator with XRE-family HTH domain